MNITLSGVLLALSTMFSLIGAGSFMTLAVIAEISPVKKRCLKNLGVLSAIPSLAAVFGFVTLYFGFQDQTSGVALLYKFDGAARFAVLGASGFFAAAALIYGILSVLGKISEDLRKPLLRTAGLFGTLFIVVLGSAYMLTGNPSWSTLATPVQMLGFSLLGASTLVTLMFENADALGDPIAKRILTAFAVLGFVLGVGGFVLQVVFVLGMTDVAGVELVRAASMQVTVGIFCLAAALVFALMAIRVKETGFHSVISVVCAFIGVFCVLLAFYTL